jgi:hypothetical protein
MSTYNKINDELGYMWMYYCLVFVGRWGYKWVSILGLK